MELCRNSKRRTSSACYGTALLPQDALDWLDAAFTVDRVKGSYFPLPAPAGIRKTDFAQNFMANSQGSC